VNKTLKELSEFLGGKLHGNGNIIISGVGDLESAKEGQISFIKDKTYLEKSKSSKASAIIIPPGIEIPEVPAIEIENPYLAFSKLLGIIYKSKQVFFKGIHSTAVIGKDVKIGLNVSVGPCTVVEDSVSIQDNTVICSNVYIGTKSIIGTNCLIYPNVSIREESELGNNVIIHCGTVIGSDGFGYIPVKEKYHKIPQIGKVVIEDDVEIGSNSSIDRATIDKTLICKGVKIDNQVHVAHNVVIGENTILLAHVTIAGSTKIGKHCVFSGQSGAIDNLTVGDNVIAASRAGILQDTPSNSVLWGMPALPIKEQKKITLATKNLPELSREFRELKKKVEKLEEKMK